MPSSDRAAALPAVRNARGRLAALAKDLGATGGELPDADARALFADATQTLAALREAFGDFLRADTDAPDG